MAFVVIIFGSLYYVFAQFILHFRDLKDLSELFNENSPTILPTARGDLFVILESNDL